MPGRNTSHVAAVEVCVSFVFFFSVLLSAFFSDAKRWLAGAMGGMTFDAADGHGVMIYLGKQESKDEGWDGWSG